jgi:hypothetical protein
MHRTSLPTAQEACAAHSQPAAAASLPPSPAGCASPAGRSDACTLAAPPAVHASSLCAGSPCAVPPRKASPATLAPPCAALAPGAAATRPRRAPVRASRMSASPLTRPTAAATAASSPGRTGGRLSRPADRRHGACGTLGVCAPAPASHVRLETARHSAARRSRSGAPLPQHADAHAWPAVVHAQARGHWRAAPPRDDLRRLGARRVHHCTAGSQSYCYAMQTYVL